MASWVMGVISSTSYAGIVMLMFVENVFPPIPSEVIMPLAGYMVTKGQLSFFWIVVAGTLGSVLGALPLYHLGAKVGEERLKRLADRHGRWLTVSRGDLESAKRWFDRYGGAAVFICRLLPGIRSVISIPAGMSRMSLGRFLVYTAAGAAIWTAMLAYFGYFLGSSFGKVDDYLDVILWILLGGIAVIYVVRVARHKGRPDAPAQR